MTQTESVKQTRSSVIKTFLDYYERLITTATQHERLALLLIFLLAFLIRFVSISLLVGLNSPPTYDGIGYHILAANLMQGKGYVREDGQPTAFRPPTYSLFLAGVYSLFGFNYSAGRLAQAIAGSLTCLVVYALGRKLFSRHVGGLASAGVAVYPLFIYMTGEFFPDTVALLPAMLALWVAVHMTENRTIGWPLLLGILLGITVTLRTTTTLLLPFLVLWCFVVFGLKRAVANAALLLGGFLIVLTPWIVRNYIVFREFIPLGSNSGVSLWAGNNPIAEGRGTPVLPGSWEGPNPPDRSWGGWSGVPETESSRRFYQAAIDWIRRNPLNFVSLIPKKLAHAWSPVSYGVAYSRQVSTTLVVLVLPPYLLFLALAFIGVWTHRHQWRQHGPLYCTALAVSASAVVFFGATRHALIMHESLILFAAVGVESVIENLRLATFPSDLS